MDRIASFSVDHTKLLAGLYLSRVDTKDGQSVSTFDIRFTAPNREPVLDMPALHTIEHIGATYLRNCPKKSDVVYFGPMGCRTGFYLVIFGDLKSEDIFDLVVDMCEFIVSFEGDIPGAKPEECGNYSEQNLPMAKYYTAKYLKQLTENRRLKYPD